MKRLMSALWAHRDICGGGQLQRLRLKKPIVHTNKDSALGRVGADGLSMSQKC